MIDTRIAGRVLLRRFLAGGMKSLAAGRPISARECTKVSEWNPTSYDWWLLCESAAAAALLEAQVCAQAKKEIAE